MTKRILNSSFAMRKHFELHNDNKLQWFPGHMKKGLDQIQSSLREIDAILEVHDARIPFSGRNPQIRDVVHVRPHVMILNKSDLADLSRKEDICDKLKTQGVTNIYFTNGIGTNILKNIKNEIVPKMLQEVQNRPRYRTDILNTYNIMVIGIPNVGKSTLLNKMRQTYTTKRKCARVGAMPGVTRSVMNKVKVNFDPPMYVVDTPGILSPKIANVDVGMRLALCDCLPNRLVGEDLIADYLLYWLNKHENFSYVQVYNMKEPTDNIMQFLSHVALENKLLRKDRNTTGKVQFRVDFTKAACTVIKDFQMGLFGKVLLDDDLLV